MLKILPIPKFGIQMARDNFCPGVTKNQDIPAKLPDIAYLDFFGF